MGKTERKKIFSLGFRFLGNHGGYLVVIFLGFAPHLSTAGAERSSRRRWDFLSS
jgi:hypothetical protein